jgi:hypothetical protein
MISLTSQVKLLLPTSIHQSHKMHALSAEINSVYYYYYYYYLLFFFPVSVFLHGDSQMH